MKKINSNAYGGKVMGVLIELGFFCYLGIELRQDKKISKFYEAHPDSTKTPQEILDGATD